jgi:uncharacterized membrane protein YtjA (UPF0391 family)
MRRRHFFCTFRLIRFAPGHEAKEEAMSGLLKWALVFMVISLIAALFGFSGIAAGSADISQVLFFTFLAICVVLFILGLTVFRSLPPV